jgi:hypothetical protein
MTGQKKILVQAFNALLEKRSTLRLGKVLWFNFRDPAGSKTGNQICGYCASSGLLNNTWGTKPAWSAFLNYTGG